MIGADDDAGDAFAGHQFMRAVLADVVKGADLAIPAPDAKEVLPGDFESEVSAGFGDLTDMASELPCAGEEPPHLLRVDVGVGVVAGV